MSKIHWPSVALLAVIVVCACASPIAFFVLVPERMIDKLITLPWTTILAVGVPAVVAAIGVVRQAFAPRVVQPTSRTFARSTSESHMTTLPTAFVEGVRRSRDGSASIALLGDLIGLAACVSAAVWLVLRAGL